MRLKNSKMEIKNSKLKICSRCIYDERVPQITFNEDGVCGFCEQTDRLIDQFGTGKEKGKRSFLKTVEEIKKAGKGKKYDLVVGVSGGTDSSYLLYLAKKHNLRPLAVHFDNTWNTSIASQNISKVTKALDIDLYTHVVDNKEFDDIYKSFLKAGVPELEAPTDLALAETLYRAASKFKVNYIFEGHSFVEEGITPLGNNYFDGKYIQTIHNKYGTLKMKTYPLMTFWRFLYWILFKRIKKIRPFWFIDYNKEDAKTFLKNEFDWQDYGGHHLENRTSAFLHSYFLPNKFNIDYRNNSLSAKVRRNKKTREEAWKEYNTPPYLEENIITYFKSRLELSDKEFEKIINGEKRYWKEFKTYKKRFEFLSPLFFILANANLVPTSFYLKYCSASK